MGPSARLQRWRTGGCGSIEVLESIDRVRFAAQRRRACGSSEPGQHVEAPCSLVFTLIEKKCIKKNAAELRLGRSAAGLAWRGAHSRQSCSLRRRPDEHHAGALRLLLPHALCHAEPLQPWRRFNRARGCRGGLGELHLGPPCSSSWRARHPRLQLELTAMACRDKASVNAFVKGLV